MSASLSQSTPPLLRVYLAPFALLILLYLLIIGFGSAWLYYSAKQAQTELVADNIITIVSPFIKQLKKHYIAHKDTNEPSLLSEKVKHLYKVLPHLRQISIRDRKKGYGVRLTSNGQLVDVELEPIKTNPKSSTDRHQLAQQVHQQKSALFSVDFDLSPDKSNPVQLSIAFDRAGLVGQINDILQTLIHGIIGFSTIGLLSIFIAITIAIYTGLSTKKMEARLQRIYHQAEMGKLSSSLVHDLRNPLTSIRANIQNLLISPDETTMIINELDHDLLSIEQKLTDFLTMTKPRNSGFETIDPKLFFSELIRKIEPLFRQKNINLVSKFGNNLPALNAIPEDLRNAVLNMLMNAKNHTPAQGHVWIKIQSNRKTLQIIIEDDGSGIDSIMITKIFEPFFTTRKEGHGLGLAIVKRIVKAHNGNITAENRFPNGARFIMTIPINNEQ